MISYDSQIVDKYANNVNQKESVEETKQRLFYFKKIDSFVG